MGGYAAFTILHWCNAELEKFLQALSGTVEADSDLMSSLTICYKHRICFPALGTGYLFSRTSTGSMFSHARHRTRFPALNAVNMYLLRVVIGSLHCLPRF